jgi:hypothetical protein
MLLLSFFFSPLPFLSTFSTNDGGEAINGDFIVEVGICIVGPIIALGNDGGSAGSGLCSDVVDVLEAPESLKSAAPRAEPFPVACEPGALVGYAGDAGV